MHKVPCLPCLLYPSVSRSNLQFNFMSTFGYCYNNITIYVTSQIGKKFLLANANVIVLLRTFGIN